MSTLDPIAVSNAPLLRAVGAGGHPTLAALAEAGGKNPKHINRDLDTIESRGLIAWRDGAPTHEPDLTPAGAEQLSMLDRAEGSPLFDALSGSVGTSPGMVRLRHDQVAPGHNARKDFPEAELDELADSLAEQGILQPIGVKLVDGGAHLIAFGERRWRAWGILVARGTWTAERLEPCKLIEGDERSTRIAGLIENVQSANLTQLEYGEEYLTLERDFGMKPSQIAEATGQTSEHARRNIQWQMKVAREASEENKAKFRASIGLHRATRGKEQETFTWTRLRESVGAAADKPKLSLDLTPKLAMALVEICDAAERRPVEVRGEPRYVRLASPPTGGPIQTLAYDRKTPLLTLKVADGAAYIRPQLHAADVAKYLVEIGFGVPGDVAARRKCLFEIRAAVVGQLDASRYADGAYVLPELNLTPEAEAHQARLEQSNRDRAAARQTHESVSSPSAGSPRPEGPGDGGEADQAHGPQAGALDAAPVAAARPFADVTPAEWLQLVEIAHRTRSSPCRTNTGAPAAETTGPFYHDSLSAGLVTGKRMEQFVPSAKGGMVCVLTERAREALASREWSDATALDILEARKAVGLPAWDEGAYVTAWLNPAPAAARPSPPGLPPETPAQPAPVGEVSRSDEGAGAWEAGTPPVDLVEGHPEPIPQGPPPSGYHRDSFSQAILDVAREDHDEALAATSPFAMARALLELDGAASHANSTLVAMRKWLSDPDAKPPTVTEVEAAIAAIGEARETAMPLIDLAEAACAGEEG